MSERFAIVHWEDKFKSIINLVNVRSPRISIADYAEGSYITALYQKRPYKARISEISDDRSILMSKIKGELKFSYSDEPECDVNTARPQEKESVDVTAANPGSAVEADRSEGGCVLGDLKDCNVDCETGPPERTPAKTSGLKTQEPDSDVHSVMPQESIPIDLKKSGQESSKSPGDIAGSQGSSKSPGDKLSSLTSRDRIRQLEGEVKSLKRRQKRLEDKFEELKKAGKQRHLQMEGYRPCHQQEHQHKQKH